MKRFISLFLALNLLSAPAQAIGLTGQGIRNGTPSMGVMTRGIVGGVVSEQNNIIEKLTSYGGATFIKDFSHLPVGTVTATQLQADHAIGSKTATFTASRGASNPATYIDGAGLIQTTTTSNVGRLTAGFYDSTGFVSRPGLIVEGASTNLVPKSSVIDDATWTESNTVADNADAGSSSPDGTATAPSLTASAANGTLLLTTAVTAQTYSVFLKRKTGTGNVDITANGGTGWTTVTLYTDEWVRVQVTATSASQTCGIRIVADTDAIYVWCNQFEALPLASTPILTLTAALTRNVETLTYLIAGNRTAPAESIFINFLTFWSGSQATINYRFMDTDTVDRVSFVDTSTDSFNFRPSGTSPSLNFTTDPTTYTSNVYTMTMTSSDVNPNTVIYVDGSQQATDNTNFSAPGWGTNFYVGCSDVANRQLNGIISSLAIFSDAKSAGGVAAISTLMAA